MSCTRLALRGVIPFLIELLSCRIILLPFFLGCGKFAVSSGGTCEAMATTLQTNIHR